MALIPFTPPPQVVRSAAQTPSYMFAALVTANQSIPNNARTTVVFDTVVQSLGMTMAAGVITVNAAGLYIVTVATQYGSAIANSVQQFIQKNGADYFFAQRNNMGNNDTLGSVGLINCAAGDTIQVIAWHNAGVAAPILSGSAPYRSYIVVSGIVQ